MVPDNPPSQHYHGIAGRSASDGFGAFPDETLSARIVPIAKVATMKLVMATANGARRSASSKPLTALCTGNMAPAESAIAIQNKHMAKG
jgi:hypothetical protein